MRTDSLELQELYSQIENDSDDEIKNLISSIYLPRFAGTASMFGFPFHSLWRSEEDEQRMAVKELQDVCVDCANTIEFKNQIKLMLQNNPQRTNFVIGIIQLLVPAIAQQYSGIPAMAFVGAITLLCRQGIENYLKD